MKYLVPLILLPLAGCTTTIPGDNNRMYNQWCMVSFNQCGIDHASTGPKSQDKQFDFGDSDDHEGELSSAIPYHSPLNWENN